MTATVVASVLLTLPEVAERLRKSEDAVRWMIRQGTGPRPAKIGGRWLWREADVERYIDAAFAEAS